MAAHLLRAALVGAICLIAVGARAQCDAGLAGRVSATGFAPVPAATALAVRPLNDSPAQMEIKDSFVKALGTRSWRVTEPPAPLNLNFESEVQQLGRSSTETSFGRVRAGSSSQTELVVNLYSNTQDSLAAGRQSEPRGSLRYVLTATLDDQRTGRRLWQGEATYEGTAGDEQSILRAMTPLLADIVGQTVRVRPFSLK